MSSASSPPLTPNHPAFLLSLPFTAPKPLTLYCLTPVCSKHLSTRLFSSPLTHTYTCTHHPTCMGCVCSRWPGPGSRCRGPIERGTEGLSWVKSSLCFFHHLLRLLLQVLWHHSYQDPAGGGGCDLLTLAKQKKVIHEWWSKERRL